MALGQGYPETGSRVHSALHWDLVNDLRGGGTVLADGEPVLSDGKILVGEWSP